MVERNTARERRTVPKKSKTIPRIYVDTNVIIDCTEGRNKDSIHLMEQIREHNFECITSVFSALEVADNAKETIFVSKKLRQRWTFNKIRREVYRKDLNNEDFKEVEEYIENKILYPYPFFYITPLDLQGWRSALDLCIHSNVSAPDILHLATAWDSKCNVLVTSDDHLIKESRKLIKKYSQLRKIKLEVCRPNKTIPTLRKMGFKI